MALHDGLTDRIAAKPFGVTGRIHVLDCTQTFFGSTTVTEPHSALLDRSFQQQNSAQLIGYVCPVLREIVAYGTALFARANASIAKVEHRLKANKEVSGHPGSDTQDYFIPLTLLYLSALETLDAIEASFSLSVVTPCRAHVRTLFEILLQLEWLYADQSVSRAHNYLVFDVHKRLRYYESTLADTQIGKAVLSAQSKDRWAKWEPQPGVEGAETAIASLKALLTHPGYAEAESLFVKDKPRVWYAVSNGPTSIEQLAHRLSRGYQYERCYRPLSGSTHAGDSAGRVQPPANVPALRTSVEMPTLASLAIGFILDATDAFGDFFRPEEKRSRAKWFRDVISQPWMQINAIRIELVHIVES